MSKKWSDEELEKLTTFYQGGIPDVEIAEKLNRTKNSVVVKRKRMGLTDIHKRRFPDESLQLLRESRKKYRGENHPSWKGGRRVNFAGYVEVHEPNHHRSRKNGYVFEHIIVAERNLGRKLYKNEVVHHKNKNKTDNRIENLEIIDRGEHSVLHAFERRSGEYKKCVVCNEEYYAKPSHAKRRKCCSRKCVGKYTYLKRKGELQNVE